MKDGWRPIKSAPKDGMPVLLYCEAWDMTWGDVREGVWDEEAGSAGAWRTAEGAVEEDETDEGFDDEGPYSIAPTHWMPLPPPPSQAEEKG